MESKVRPLHTFPWLYMYTTLPLQIWMIIWVTVGIPEFNKLISRYLEVFWCLWNEFESAGVGHRYKKTEEYKCETKFSLINPISDCQICCVKTHFLQRRLTSCTKLTRCVVVRWRGVVSCGTLHVRVCNAPSVYTSVALCNENRVHMWWSVCTDLFTSFFCSLLISFDHRN